MSTSLSSDTCSIKFLNSCVLSYNIAKYSCDYKLVLASNVFSISYKLALQEEQASINSYKLVDDILQATSLHLRKNKLALMPSS